MCAADTPYRGRFAPSPTGPLHFGSLLAAVGSRLQACFRGGEWLVRIEDLDPPREQAGSADDILRTLEAYGLHWDGSVLYQSARAEVYRAALDVLRAGAVAYPCACTRKEVAEAGGGAHAPVYPGTCRRGIPPGRPPRAWRVLTTGAQIGFEDRLQGSRRQRLEAEVGDFIVRRADGLFAYQLAVVVDDAEQAITEVVRGSDLLESTPRQIHLQRLLGLATPEYAHLPVAVNARGQKLSKQTHAAPLDREDPIPALWRALAFLGQRPPPELRTAGVDELWDWAVTHWDLAKVPRRERCPMPGEE
ncbi:MAG: tRNA glutamyl-Q(34) synthetase GluQRS [Gammaproteobacteria bacterium]|nr:tRNA glutamyl-Q(34) synthetase GluQRS [Gammaproteobacteria bacterium]NIR97768.1 tRNA glutamyl-Q(34) synthetase GluQRS [Gammaproteobacteria bacterium]NIT63478.1 tRNA glutamyl-Q(34) synthetase GluQRS [Gammaproteobacteria bacterium]NIV20416.1 tRNA glutamyl-Q(34) synthetase GluQRS [Gammaproteobacteria bacterium]NIX10990.1 tRNA glutamyl-Q(34) synthetase GluQRS [Gammaproteobacteria bacterium]